MHSDHHPNGFVKIVRLARLTLCGCAIFSFAVAHIPAPGEETSKSVAQKSPRKPGNNSAKAKPGRNAPSAPKGEVLATVDAVPITTASVELWMIQHHIPAAQRAKLQTQVIEPLIDERLIQSFLNSRKIEVPAAEVDRVVKRWDDFVQREKQDPQEVRERLGYSEESLREILSVPSAWQIYLNEVVTPKKLNAYFEEHRQEFDGTRVRASQILKKLPDNATDADAEKVRSGLLELRKTIAAGSLVFADAARAQSDAPSKTKGGDVGFFTYRGSMPTAITQRAFQLKPGEISEPIRTPFGWHLVTVTEIEPGQLNLEDVRTQVLAEIGQSMWNETALRLREKAKIERNTPQSEGEQDSAAKKAE
ncbi:MAG: peptidylprolyl isomerase [Planctomycetaceae bacterium]